MDGQIGIYNFIVMKLLVFDVDGTLVGANCVLSRKNMVAINKRLRKGDVIAIASGRPYEGIKHYLDKFVKGTKFAIGANGAAVYDYDGNLMRIQGIDYEEFLALRDRHHDFVEKGHSVYCFTSREVGYYEYTPQIEFEVRTNYFPSRDLAKEPFKEGEKLLKMMINAPREELDQIVLTEEDRKFHCMRSEPYYLEFVAQGVDKSVGVEFLRNHLGLNKEGVFTFGDQANDVKMIQNYNGIAMMNGIRDCKKEAKFITKHVSENGVAYAIEYFVDKFAD